MTMDIYTFQLTCEDVVLVDELPPVSELRQKVAGCYEVFGMCPQGEIVALDINGNVNCLKADVGKGGHFCEEDGTPCKLEAVPPEILGVMDLLRNFIIENFITKKGLVTKQYANPEPGQADRDPVGGDSAAMEEKDYSDEDVGVSHYLTEGGKRKRRSTANHNPSDG
jgi:hypothetical protein